MLVGDYRQAESLSLKNPRRRNDVGAQPKARAFVLVRWAEHSTAEASTIRPAKYCARRWSWLEAVAIMREWPRYIATWAMSSLPLVRSLPPSMPTKKGRQIAESIGDQAGVAAAHTVLCNALARAETSTMRCDTARWRWNSANGSAMSDASPGQIFYWAIGHKASWDAAIRLGAHKYNSEAQRIFARIGDYRGLAWVLWIEADVAFVNNNSDLAVRHAGAQYARRVVRRLSA